MSFIVTTMGFAIWTIGVIGIAIVAYLFLLFAYSSMEEPKSFVYYSEVDKPKILKSKKPIKQSKVLLGTLVKK